MGFQNDREWQCQISQTEFEVGFGIHPKGTQSQYFVDGWLGNYQI